MTVRSDVLSEVLRKLEKTERLVERLVNEEPRLLNKRQAAKMLGVSVKTFDVLLADCRMHPGILVGGHRVWWPAIIDECAARLKDRRLSLKARVSSELARKAR